MIHSKWYFEESLIKRRSIKMRADLRKALVQPPGTSICRELSQPGHYWDLKGIAGREREAVAFRRENQLSWQSHREGTRGMSLLSPDFLLLLSIGQTNQKPEGKGCLCCCPGAAQSNLEKGEEG